ncbi:uncharacterized protein [Rutidosis leptorrhynchoides]|uniref:uncharacterized protein n=1 Tax=Rutidosis leptorrhynchoides TaxID=125765 RepID=UPI003A999389
MEGLQAAINDATNASLYSGVRIGGNQSSIRINHCLFADDVLFVGEWNDTNACNLLSILGCFFSVSGLKINLSKSLVYGVGVDSLEIMASMLGCSPGSMPFKFLGLPVGQNMHRSEGWEYIIDKWRLIQNPYDRGGLSVSCLKSLNLALLYKWRWRFTTNKDSSWAKVISAIHGPSNNSHTPCSPNASGSWACIHNCIHNIHNRNIILAESLRCKLGNGSHIDFWHDPWLDFVPLKTRYHRLFALENMKIGTVASHFSLNGWH